VSAWIGEGTGAKLPIRNRRREDMWRHTPILVALGLAGLGAALPADQVVVYRELVKGEPQGLGRFFEVPERLFVRGTFDLPLPDPVIGLELVRNTTSILNKPFDLKGDTTKFDLRLTPPDGRPFQPGVYTFTITQAGRALAHTTFLVGYRLPPPEPRVYWGPPLPEGVDPFAQPGAPADIKSLPPPPAPIPLVVLRRNGDGRPADVRQPYTTADRLYARLTLGAPVLGGRAHLRLMRDGAVVSEGEIKLGEHTVSDINLVTDVGFPTGAYVLTITDGQRVLGEARFTVQAPSGQ
jgi:hypothetical protein